MNHDSIVLNLDDGTDIIGNDNHIDALTAYNFIKKILYGIFSFLPMHVDGQNGDWVFRFWSKNITETRSIEVNLMSINFNYIQVDGKISY